MEGHGEGWVCPRLLTEWVNRLGLVRGWGVGVGLGPLVGTPLEVRIACVGGSGLLNWDWTGRAVFLGHWNFRLASPLPLQECNLLKPLIKSILEVIKVSAKICSFSKLSLKQNL